MGITRQFQTYYAISLVHHVESWGGVDYNEILSTDYMDTDLISTVSTAASTLDFIYPSIYKNKYYLDGIATGHFTLYNNNHSTSTATVSSYTISLLKTEDVPLATTVLGSVTETLSSDNTIPPENYLTLPIFMILDKALVEAGEKLILRIEYTSTGGDMCIMHDNDSTEEDTMIELPYYQGG